MRLTTLRTLRSRRPWRCVNCGPDPAGPSLEPLFRTTSWICIHCSSTIGFGSFLLHFETYPRTLFRQAAQICRHKVAKNNNCLAYLIPIHFLVYSEQKIPWLLIFTPYVVWNLIKSSSTKCKKICIVHAMPLMSNTCSQLCWHHTLLFELRNIVHLNLISHFWF